MKPIQLLVAFCSFLLAASVQAQWQTTNYSLKGGWNGIYLTGDAGQADIGAIFPAEVLEVWRWNSNPSQVQFTESPMIPSAGTPEWSVWRRGLPQQSTFSKLTGQTSYLVKCVGTAANTYPISLKQSPLMPKADWVRDGANLLGFPSKANGSNFPTFASYFAPFPAVTATDIKIFKYIGGDLGTGNPMQVFSPTVEQIDRTKAYWFSAEVGGSYYAPLEVSASASGGLAYGRTGTVVTLTIRNRTATASTVTLAPLPSEAAPSGQTPVAGPVPITRRTFDASIVSWVETPFTAPISESVPALGSVELKFGIDRKAMSGPADALYASLLKMTDSGNLLEIFLPVTASRKSSLAGLWMGDITLTNVESRMSSGATAIATATATVTGGAVNTISLTSGGYGYVNTTAEELSDPTLPRKPIITIEAPASGAAATAFPTVENGVVVAITLTGGGSGYTRAPRIQIGGPPPSTGSSVPDTSRMWLRTIMHVAENGDALLLPKVFLGQLKDAPFDVGICTREDLLKQDAKATAQRLVSAHLPSDSAAISGSGKVTIPGSFSCEVTVAFDAASNPFVHQYHPDHDNKNARGAALPAGVESYGITRQCTFDFTPSPPAGSGSSIGWGSSVIGGTYTEIITGLHKNPIRVNGTFELRRASEISTIQQ